MITPKRATKYRFEVLLQKIIFMRKFATLILFSVVFVTTINAQTAPKALLHYWNFNNFTTTGIAGNPDTIAPIHSDYTILTNANLDSSIIYYRRLPGVSSAYQSYWDFFSPGDTTNCRKGAVIGNCLRPRNMDSMQMIFKVSTRGYTNIQFTYAVERSGSGPQADSLSYSVDGGATWKTSGITNPVIPVVATAAPFDSNRVFITDPSAANNPSFCFRIIASQLTAPLKGNNRFDNITVEGDPTVTPVTLISFTGVKEENDVKLNWSFTNPVNVKDFEIEHSIDGKSFASIATVLFNNTNQSIYDFSYTDNNAVAGTNYYRLITVDNDGSTTSSNIITVQNKATVRVSVSPNPAKNTLHVSHNLGSTKNIVASIYSMEGKKISAINISNRSAFDLNIANLNIGAYFLVLENDSDKTTTQFIKQ